MRVTKKYDIVVLKNADFWGEHGETVKTIKRILKGESIGNYNPMFTVYEGKKYLVKSGEGDLSDPFRRKESYAKTLFIDVGDNPGWVGSPEESIAHRHAMGYDLPPVVSRESKAKAKPRRKSTSRRVNTTSLRGIR